MSKLSNFFLAFFLMIQLGCSSPTFEISELTVEYLENPTGISSTTSPRFGWKLTSTENGTLQTFYQLSVSKAGAEIWNSGKVESDQSQLVPFGGAQLEAAMRYRISLTVWDNKGNTSTKESWFETAPAEDQLTAKWIGAIRRENANLPQGRGWHAPSLKQFREFYDSIPEIAKRSILLRKGVTITDDVRKATAYVSGLGHYELRLNGSKVGNSEFAPLWTDYDKSVFYNTFDLTDNLQMGENAIGVILGNGMYNAIGDRYRKFWVSFGPPTLFFQLEIDYKNGEKETIISDGSWKWKESPITFNDIFGGEDYDARLEVPNWDTKEFSDNWNPVVIQDAPKGELKPQLAPEVKVKEVLAVKNSWKADTVWVIDMGQNHSGFPSIKVQGKAGQTIRLVVGERIDKDSTVNQRNTGRPHYYEYTLKGEGIEEWQPRFSYYGYQYVQVEGASFGDEVSDLPILVDLKSNFIYSEAPQIGQFSCSNEIFTKTHDIINKAIQSNMQAVFTDCPHREKLGWLEEIHLNGHGLMYNYNLTQLLSKEMMDMADAQRENGLVPNIAPEYTDFSAFSWGADFTDSPEWGAALVLVPWQYFEFYGDDTLIRQYYPTMKKFVDYLTSRSERFIVSHGLGDWYDYGEHRAGYSKNSPISLSATSHYLLSANGLRDAAQLIGNKEDFVTYSALSDSISDAFNREFFNFETNQYATGSQFSNAMALYLDVVPEGKKEVVLNNLLADIANRGNRLTTGDVGNKYLFQTLANNDLNEVMYQMHNHNEVPGYGYQIEQGMTTLTEQWDPTQGNSWNHFMLGQIEEWFFKSLAGIQSDPENPGFKHFYIRPDIVGDMTWVKASTESLYGQISVDWKIENGEFRIDLAIPVNSTATFVPPEEVKSEDREIQLESGKHTLTYSMK